MPIPFSCPHCGRAGRIPDTYTGERVKCPGCQNISPLDRSGATRPQPRRLATDHDPSLAPRSPRPLPPGLELVEESESSNNNATVLIAASVGSVVFVLAAGLIFMLMRGGSKNPAPDAPAVAVAETTKSAVDTAVHDATPEAVPTVDSTTPRIAESSAQTINRIKDASVYIKVRMGKIGASGSGFVVRVDGDTVLVATNHHVVNPHMENDEDAYNPQLTGMRADITAVFRSGAGPGLEQSLPATILAMDRVGNRDLAILQVKGLKDVPRPIELSSGTNLVETMPVLIFGFPFGNINEMLSQTKGNPQITINKGSVSSIRKDDAGQVTYVQIDGSLNPGNSGGPVVDEQGKLVGVSVAGISNTTIGFAIPPRELSLMLDGRVGMVRLALRGEAGTMADVQARVPVIDPLKKLKSVDLLYLPAEKGTEEPRPRSDGTYLPMPNAKEVNVVSTAGGIGSARFQTAVGGPAGRRLLIQTRYQDNAGRIVYTKPLGYMIPSRIAASTGEGNPEGMAPSAGVAVSFNKLEDFVDADKDCTLKRTSKSMRLVVPAGVHLMSADLNIKNSPMCLTELEGDFLVHVRVPGTMLPGTDPAKTKSKTLPFTYMGAGLVIFQDKNNYVRLERAAKTKRGVMTLSSEVLVEVCKNGKPSGNFYMKIPDGPLHVQILRHEGAIHCMFGPNGRQWVLLKKLAIPFAFKLQVGVIASNASKEDLMAEFERFALITEKKEMDEAAKSESPETK